MSPSVDTLATRLEQFPVATLTLLGDDARSRMLPMNCVRTRFNGHVWLRTGIDPTPAIEIGRGAEVSVAYGSLERGHYVTIYGWAIVLRNPAYARSLLDLEDAPLPATRDPSRPLICVTARAAEMWDMQSPTLPRIFAFSNTQPAGLDDPVELMQDSTPLPREPRATALGGASL
ncbi:MAG: hypothetical protein EHM59_05630 [Betaproteobacteria bacterium]|nr:MAG: hypothetical protein EHM59_05630 [Betaproteobacteria bacterium]